VAAEVGDGGDVASLLDDGRDERLAEEAADPGDVDGSGAGDLAGLAGQRVTANEGFVVDHHVGRVPAGSLRRRSAEHGVGERVGGVGVL
jgi:hypothetical protein